MAGRGPAPKDPKKRQRRNADTVPATTIRREVVDQPELPPHPTDEWSSYTCEWWEMWGNSPQAEHFGTTDWNFLAETAFIHDKFWKSGDPKYAIELRLRVAKYGATPEDRARLRMQFSDADEKESKHAPGATASAASSPKRYGNVTHLRAVEA